MSDCQWSLPPAAQSVVTARRHVRDVLRRWGYDDLVDAAQLLTSEIVTNAVLHARTVLELVVTRTTDGVRVDVRDGSPLPPAMRSHGSNLATTGRGLQLLQTLAASWASEPTATGKTVWFVLREGHDPWAAYSDANWLEAEL